MRESRLGPDKGLLDPRVRGDDLSRSPPGAIPDHDPARMLLIPCPWCGERAEIEFVSGGEVVPRPIDPSALAREAWTEYLYFRDNRCGPQAEHWWHVHGCRRWLVVERDTATHEILSVRSSAETP